ncbi:MAG: prephenate dehydratase [Desulfovibrionaceae bacterium]|nr:prephenate dehydratase [Desulfovibrionaceae bacterium]
MDADTKNDRLSHIRAEIDQVDSELLALLNRRAALSREVGKIKAGELGPIFKPLREHDLLNSLARRNEGILPEEHMRSIWREILSSSRALQRPQDVAYLGPEGTFSFFAGLEYLGSSAIFHPCRDIAEIFEMVHESKCELGIVPLENSLQGTVGASFDLFLKFPMRIQAELFSRISHCFLTRAHDFSSISTIYSHPQPLAQCSIWLRTHLPNASLIPVESTASAARRASESDSSAAIGHSGLSVRYGLSILASRIEDEPGNWTRFVVIARPAQQAQRTSGEKKAEKTSVLFTLKDRPGALSRVLDCLAKNNINMRKLESRPIKSETWKYVFFADVECDLEAKEYAPLVQSLKEACSSFRILGSYCIGPQLDRTCSDADSLDIA